MLGRTTGKAVMSRAGRNGSVRQASRSARYGSNDLNDAFTQLLRLSGRIFNNHPNF